ncbi:MAG: NAD(P)-dependent oxidoreductase [Verrucomicrobia bacterium]|nr:NAD(P)-dependent oxidoreductase [Verrucomicrobiota bacterium]
MRPDAETVQPADPPPDPPAPPRIGASGAGPSSTSEVKYAWSEVPRQDPPKREAEERSADYLEIYRLYDPETVMAQAARCVQCAMAFCSLGCPLGNRIPEWLGLAAEGRFIEAAAVSRSTSNMPEICSRVCPQERLCEGMCTLIVRADPVPIGAIEKFINEYAFARDAVDAVRVMPNGRSVAVAGSGPASLACADELAALGYAVTVFEALPILGGLLAGGIPSFKLDKSVVDRRIALLEKKGVRFRTGVRVGSDISLGDLLARHDAVFLGMGAPRARELDIPGCGLPGVYQAMPFLVRKNLGTASGLPDIDVRGKSVAVLGGGDTAMDCLRTAIRAGARQAVCLYRRDLANMPGSRKEYRNALEEGAQFVFLTSPIGIEGDPARGLTHVRCSRMALGDPDAKGRRKPYAVPHSEFTVPADIVLVAYGFDPISFPPESEWSAIAVDESGGIVVDKNQMTTLDRVFSGGDQVRGANLVVYAVRDGRKAAAGIHRCLSERAPQA